MVALQSNDAARPVAGPHLPDGMPAQRPCPAGAREIGKIDLAGRACRLLLVDGLIPSHCESSGTRGVRLTYAEGEIVHFEFEGHRYALAVEMPRQEDADTHTDKTPGMAVDITRVLSCRELQVVQLVSMGLLTKQVADRLQISEFTVRSYLKSIYAKLGVRSRAALVFCYMKAFSEGHKADG
ncbi:response regulator transcription factor [Cupriavidus necator]|uniref:response regulator transcription factor n=1 Tax=Cupriavidus necator TaxID=106590 RepID=UPI0039C18BB7